MKSFFRRLNNRKKGFTLAELLIVVAIIAVLVVISIPIFSGKLDQARVATTEANIRAAKAAAMADYMGVARNQGDKNWLEALADYIVVKVKAANGTYDEDCGTYRLYCYDASKNTLEATSVGAFEAYYEAHPSSTNLCTIILVEISDNGILGTKPCIDSNGKVDKNNFGGAGNIGGSGTNSGGTNSGDDNSGDNNNNGGDSSGGEQAGHSGGSNNGGVEKPTLSTDPGVNAR